MSKNSYVLIVEDDNNDEELAKLALGENDLELNIKLARDGIEACRILFETDLLPHFVLLDLKLPKVSGLEVLQKIRANEKTKYLPVVVFTSSKEETDIEAAYKYGANAFIQKPINFAEFSSAIQQTTLFWVLLNKTMPPK